MHCGIPDWMYIVFPCGYLLNEQMIIFWADKWNHFPQMRDNKKWKDVQFHVLKITSFESRCMIFVGIHKNSSYAWIEKVIVLVSFINWKMNRTLKITRFTFILSSHRVRRIIFFMHNKINEIAPPETP